MPTTVEPVRSKQAQAILSLILCVFQVAAVFGLAWGSYAQIVMDNQVLLIGLLSAIVGVIQSFMTSVRLRKLKGAPAPPVTILVAVVAASALLAGCSMPRNGTSAGLFPAPFVSVDREKSATTVRLLPDASDPDAFAVEATHRRKDGALPDMAFSVVKPTPDTVVGTARFRVTTATPATIEK